MEVPGKPGLFVLGCTERKRISLLSQQVRALNLAYALFASQTIGLRSNVAIIGAGPAGMRLAAGLASLGIQSQVFEKGDAPLHVFCPGKSNDQRYVHPHIAEWPNPGWNQPRAKLPVLAWNAGTPARIADARGRTACSAS
jgi:FAD binding domain